MSLLQYSLPARNRLLRAGTLVAERLESYTQPRYLKEFTSATGWDRDTMLP